MQARVLTESAHDNGEVLKNVLPKLQEDEARPANQLTSDPTNEELKATYLRIVELCKEIAVGIASPGHGQRRE